jgi:protein CpxP
MKRSVSLITSSTILAAALMAGTAGAAPQGRDPARFLEAMTQGLSLSEAQQIEIGALLEQHQQARASERQALREQIDAVLTDEQRETRDARMQERIEQRIERMTRRLDLTPEQAQQMRELFVEQRMSQTLTRTEMRERVASVLSEQQLAQLERGRPGKGGRGPGDGPGDGPSHSPGGFRQPMSGGN